MVSFSLSSGPSGGTAMLFIGGEEIGYITVSDIGSTTTVVAEKTIISGIDVTTLIPGRTGSNTIIVKRELTRDNKLWELREAIIQNEGLKHTSKVEYRSIDNTLINNWIFEDTFISKLKVVIEDGKAYEVAEIVMNDFYMESVSTNLSLGITNSNILENRNVDSVVGALSTQNGAYGEQFTYSLVSGAGDVDNVRFKIEGNQIKTKEVFDYESITNCSIRVKTTGDIANSLENNITIKITNENPKLSIYGNNIKINDDDTNPSINDMTDFGDVLVEGAYAEHEFILKADNKENVKLIASNVITIYGANEADFSIEATPDQTLVYGTPQSIAIRFNPSGTGLRTALVSVECNDVVASPYQFAIQGMGTDIPVDTFKVSYIGNGQDSGAAVDDVTEYISGSSVVVKGNENNLQKNEYVFDGWLNIIDNQRLNPGDVFLMPSQNVTLSAIWHKSTEVKLDKEVLNEEVSNNGSITDTMMLTVSYGSIIGDVTKGSVQLTNLPTGLDYNVTKIDNQTIKIQIVGNASEHEAIDSVTNVRIEVEKDILSYCENNIVFEGIDIAFNDQVIVFLTSIEISSLPNLVDFKINELITTEGMIVIKNYSDGTTLEAIGYTFHPKVAVAVGSQIQTVSYEEGGIKKTSDYEVSITSYQTSSNKKIKPPKTPSVQDLMSQAEKQPDGTQVGEIVTTQKNSEGGFEQSLPKAFFTEEQKKIIIDTPIAKVTIPDNMFDNEQSKDIQLVIKEHDKKELSIEIQKLVGDKPVIDIDLLENGKKVAWASKKSRVKLQIPYEPTKEELKDKNKIIAVYITDDNEIIPLTLSSYDPTTKSVSLETNHFSLYGVQYVEVSFKDIDDIDWAKDAIISLAARKVVNGKEKELFMPMDSITRAEYITMLVRYFNFTANDVEPFNDVEDGAYYETYVNTAKSLEIVKGYENQFRPHDFLSREEMIVMLIRAITQAQVSIEDQAEFPLIDEFNDNTMISDYAKENIALALRKGMVEGYNDNINPLGSTTRAEVAVILNRIIELIK